MKTIQAFTKEGVLAHEFESVTAASRSVGVGRQSIYNALSGKNMTAAGLVWRYAENTPSPSAKELLSRPVIKVPRIGHPKRFDSIVAAAGSSYRPNSIYRAASTRSYYEDALWLFADDEIFFL